MYALWRARSRADGGGLDSDGMGLDMVGLAGFAGVGSGGRQGPAPPRAGQEPLVRQAPKVARGPVPPQTTSAPASVLVAGRRRAGYSASPASLVWSWSSASSIAPASWPAGSTAAVAPSLCFSACA